MRIDILTLFPEIFAVPLDVSIVGRARRNNILDIGVHDMREFSKDKHGKVDDRPYGGGPGMVLRPEPVLDAVEFVKKEACGKYPSRVILMTPQGETFTQKKAYELSSEKHLIIICGRYEGIDERVRLAVVTDEISIGDYVITGGELAAMVVIEAIVRLLPGALGDENSPKEDSFSMDSDCSSGNLFATGLEYPQYTRPQEYRGMKVPEPLCSGDHEKIRKWRRREALRRTIERRPDMLEKLHLTDEDRELLKDIGSNENGCI